MTPELPIYMDYNATTPVDERVLEAMLPFFREDFGNPTSHGHAFGWKAEAAVEVARQQVADLIGATPQEIIWTSGATESNNLAIKGACEMYRDRGRHMITCRTEHRAVLEVCAVMEQAGWQVTYLPVDETGWLDAGQVEAAITDQTVLISIMAANNETGTLSPMAEIGQIAKKRGVLLHTDATQAAGKIPMNVEAMGADLLSLSAHKLYGPKGCGCLYVRRRSPRVRLAAQIHGGGHERGLRSGTLNVPGIVGLGAAAEVARKDMAADAERLGALRDRLDAGIRSQLPDVHPNGHPTKRLCNTLNLSFAYVEGEALKMKLSSLAVSSGSACRSESREPSHVLKAMGVSDALANAAIRFSLGRPTTEEDVDFAIETVVNAVRELRAISPLYELAREGIDPKRLE
jgi:cysteine desulfurase